MTGPFRTAVEKKQRAAFAIWVALTMSPIIYVGVASVVLPPPVTGQGAAASLEFQKLVLVLGSIALSEILLAVFLYRAPYSPQSMVKTMDQAVVDPNSTFAADEQRLMAVVNKLSTSSILCTSLCESVAIFGLVLSVQSGEIEYAYIGAGISILGAMIVMPRIIEGAEDAEALQKRGAV